MDDNNSYMVAINWQDLNIEIGNIFKITDATCRADVFSYLRNLVLDYIQKNAIILSNEQIKELNCDIRIPPEEGQPIKY